MPPVSARRPIGSFRGRYQFVFGAHLKRYFYTGELLTVEIAKVSGSDRLVIVSKSLPKSGSGVVFNGTATVAESGPGSYAVRLTSGQGIEAEGTVLVTAP